MPRRKRFVAANRRRRRLSSPLRTALFAAATLQTRLRRIGSSAPPAQPASPATGVDASAPAPEAASFHEEASNEAASLHSGDSDASDASDDSGFGPGSQAVASNSNDTEDLHIDDIDDIDVHDIDSGDDFFCDSDFLCSDDASERDDVWRLSVELDTTPRTKGHEEWAMDESLAIAETEPAAVAVAVEAAVAAASGGKPLAASDGKPLAASDDDDDDEAKAPPTPSTAAAADTLSTAVHNAHVLGMLNCGDKLHVDPSTGFLAVSEWSVLQPLWRSWSGDSRETTLPVVGQCIDELRSRDDIDSVVLEAMRRGVRHLSEMYGPDAEFLRAKMNPCN